MTRVSRLSYRTPRVVLIHDYLTQRGGAERVLLTMAQAFPDAPIVTSLYNAETTYPEFRNLDIRTSVLQTSATYRRDHRHAFPFYAPVFSATTVSAEVVICSTSGWAHGVRARGKKLLYVHNTARWLYQHDDQIRPMSSSARMAARLAGIPLRQWDRSRARTADGVLVNSAAVRDRVERNWGLKSAILYPPYGISPGGPCQAIPGVTPGYLLIVSRLLPYKNVEAVAEAFRLLPEHRLVIVGSGPIRELLKKTAPTNCSLLPSASDSELRWLYCNCLALVSAANEDLGLTPVEAMTFGKPVAALRAGGFLETVTESVTGTFFASPRPSEIALAIRRLASTSWHGEAITRHAAKFSPTGFIDGLRQAVDRLTDSP